MWAPALVLCKVLPLWLLLLPLLPCALLPLMGPAPVLALGLLLVLLRVMGMLCMVCILLVMGMLCMGCLLHVMGMLCMVAHGLPKNSR